MKNRNLLVSTVVSAVLLSAASLQASSYDAPDFNGDGISDLGQVWSDNGSLSVSVLLSGKKGLEEDKWINQTGSYDQTQRWFVGDFNGDQISDTACLRDDNGTMSCDVYLSTDTNGDFLNDTFKKSAWAVKSGAFTVADKWFIGDFNGDYKTDLARAYNDGGKRSVEVHLSNGAGFDAPVKWATRQGDFQAGDVWMTGSFDEAPGMDFAIVDAGSTVHISLLLSSGTAFSSTSWADAKSPRLTSMKWVAADFNGNGMTEIATLWNEAGSMSIQVRSAVEDSFTNQAWVVQSGTFEREHRWFIGDFNGDAFVDIARLWNDAGKLSIESYESDGLSFTPRMLLKQGGIYRDQNVYTVGDFNSDSKTDIAVAWADEENRHNDVIFSTGKTSIVKPLSTLPLADYFERHNLVNPVLGDTFTKYSQLSGAVPVGTDLQAVLDGGNDLLLVKNKIYNTSHSLKYKASYQRIKTMDALFINDYAILREQIDQGDYDSLIIANGQDYIHLENVVIDGNKYNLGQKGKEARVAQGAMVLVSDSVGVWLRRCVLLNARTWSTCQLSEAGHSHIVEHNYVLGAGDDPRGCGRYVDQTGHGVSSPISVGWSDGFSIAAANVTARYNFIMDCTDVGLVLFGAPGAHVHDNLILNYSKDNHGGINFVDGIEKWYMGTDSTFGEEYKCYDYRGSIIENNRIVASGCRIQIGLPIGNRIWSPRTPMVFDMKGGVVRNNLLEGDAMGYGYVLDHVKNLDFYGNKSIATHSGKGRGSTANERDPDPATAFLCDTNHIQVAPSGTLQEGMTQNTKRIEHLLFHNGNPLTEDLYYYYSYTPIEVEVMVKASYMEMLGRAPTEQELKEGSDSFLVDPKPETFINEAYKQYGDAFKRELMKRPEFIEKFGAVPTQCLQPLRTTRWRDRINANDVSSLLKTGNYVTPGDAYDNVLPELAYIPTRANAEITSISPALPKRLAQGETVRVAVTVKNNGAVVWANTPENPRKFALASVGDDTMFGMTRVYIPNGVSVQPGESYTFDFELSAPPVAWAGKGMPDTTSFPYDLKMMQEAIGYFGKTLADHLGAPHRIDVGNVEQPLPQPVYNSTFLSQSIQGDPQINGIQPGATFAVNLTFKNSSACTTSPWTQEGGFNLGSENAKDNRVWGSNRISLDNAASVPYGATVTIHALLTAPKEEGDYNFQWQMLGAGWFGQMSDNLSITVSKSAPVTELVDSQFVSIDVPDEVKPGASFAADVTFKNTGTTPWASCQLETIASVMDRTDEFNAKITSQHTDSAPEERVEMLFDNDLSTKYFTRNASAWIQHQFANEQTYRIVKYVVTSAPDDGPGPELVTNGSFEQGSENWALSSSSISTDYSVSGDSCLKLSRTDGKNTGNTTMTIKGLKDDTDYVLSFWMRQQPDTQGSFVLDTDDVYDRTCQWIKHGGQPTVWTRCMGVFNTGVVDSDKKKPNQGSVTLRLRSSELRGAVYVDDVSLVEVGGGGGGGDPQGWTLQGSNDGAEWALVDQRDGVDFSERSQRVEFDVNNPGAYEFYKLNANNKSGSTLQFGELELLTEEAGLLGDRSGRVLMDSGTTVPPGKNHTFKLKLKAPAAPGDYTLQTRLLNEFWFGEYSPTQHIMVQP